MINKSKFKELYPFRSHFIKIRGYKCHYLDEGEDSDYTMVLLHGQTTWSFMYRKLILAFKSKYRIIAPDQFGCGLSDTPPNLDYCLENHIDNLENLLFHLGLKRIILVLHGSGATLGMGFAIRHPDLIAKIIILNSAAFTIKKFPLFFRLCRLPMLGEILVKNTSFFIKFFTKWGGLGKLPAAIRRLYLSPYSNKAAREVLLKYMRYIPHTPEQVSYEVLLEIEHGLWMFREIPVCIIWGMEDWCFGRTYLDRWKLYFPNASVLEIDDAGQYLLENEPQEVIKFIKHFLD